MEDKLEVNDVSEHFCIDCEESNGDKHFPLCTLTGAIHTTGIECPSFRPKEKEVEMFKIGDKVRVVADEMRVRALFITKYKLTGVEGTITEITPEDHLPVQVDFGPDYGGTWWFGLPDLVLVEAPTEAGNAARTFVGHPEGALEVKDRDTETMTLERFDTLVDYIVEKRIKAVMCAKSAEYAQGKNKLHNFDRAATMRNISPLEALRGMKLKHEVSIEDMLDGLKEGKTYPRELWEEKFTDNINYQILEWAILARDNGWDSPAVDRTAPTLLRADANDTLCKDTCVNYTGDGDTNCSIGYHSTESDSVPSGKVQMCNDWKPKVDRTAPTEGGY